MHGNITWRRRSERGRRSINKFCGHIGGAYTQLNVSGHLKPLVFLASLKLLKLYLSLWSKDYTRQPVSGNAANMSVKNPSRRTG